MSLNDAMRQYLKPIAKKKQAILYLVGNVVGVPIDTNAGKD